MLNIKEKALEDERLKMAEILQIVAEQENVLKEMRDRKTQLEQDLEAELINGIIDIQFISNYQSYISRLDQDIKMQLDIIQKTNQELELQKIKVSQAYKEVKVLEKLKEKQLKDFENEFLRAEVKETDDITSARYKRAI